MLLFKLLIYLAVALLTAFDIEEEVDRRNFGAQVCVGLFQLLFLYRSRRRCFRL